MRHDCVALVWAAVEAALGGLVHRARLNAVRRAVSALLAEGELWLTGLGRGLATNAKLKHRIKAADRLLGNPHLLAEAKSFYQVVASLLLKSKSQPLIAVDWTKQAGFAVLRAALLLPSGRAITVYNEAHHKPRLRKVEQAFLHNLQDVLPTDCVPVIVTDAGFEGPWFAEVERLRWKYIGRLRNQTKLLYNGQWIRRQELFSKATKRARSLGVLNVRQGRPVDRRVVLYRKPPRGRINKTKRGRRARGTHEKKCAMRGYEPWVLVCSPELEMTPTQVAEAYAARFQIEQGFRDTKNAQFGFAMERCRSRSAGRINVLLLLACLASLVTELVGRVAEAKKVHHALQANTVRARRVIALPRLARLALKEYGAAFLCKASLRDALRTLGGLISYPLRI